MDNEDIKELVAEGRELFRAAENSEWDWDANPKGVIEATSRNFAALVDEVERLRRALEGIQNIVTDPPHFAEDSRNDMNAWWCRLDNFVCAAAAGELGDTE